MFFLKLIPLITTLAKTFMMNTKHDYKIKTFDKTKEKINTIEHLIVKLEKKVNETRNEIDDLRQQILFSRLMNLVLFLVVIALLIFL